MKSNMLGMSAALAAVLAMTAVLADEPAKPVSKPTIPPQAKYEAAVLALGSPNIGIRSGAIVALEEVGADETASKALRGDAWQKAIDARFLIGGGMVLPVQIDACRRALDSGLEAVKASRIRMQLAVVLLGMKDLRGAKDAVDPLAPQFDRLPREVQDDLAPLFASVLAANGDPTNAIRWLTVFLDKGLAASDSDEITQRLKLADLLVATGRAEEAMAGVSKLMDRIGGMLSQDAANVLQWVVQRQTIDGNLKAATETCRKVLAARSAAPVFDVLQVRNRLAATLYTAKEEAGAEQEYRAMLTTCKALPPDTRSQCAPMVDAALKGLLQMYRAAGRSDRVLELAQDYLSDLGVLSSSVATICDAGQWAAGTNAETVDRMIDALRKRAAKQADDAAMVDACQQAIMRMELAVPGRSAEALQEARVYYRVCLTAKLADAAEGVALAFKCADHNLSRANMFLKFQKYGPAGMDNTSGSPDDLSDPLAALPALAADAPRNKPFADALAAAAGDYAGMRTRARLLLLLGRGSEAFDALARAFELCPAKDVDLQTVTDDLTSLVVRHTRDLALAQRVVDYVMYGLAGADGKPGTPDDTGDAFGDVRKRLSANGG